jgi:VanZ family protein
MIRLPHPFFALAYLGILLAVIELSLIPAPDIGGPEGSDKALHLIAYGVIACCGGLGFRSWDTRILAATIAVGVGVFLEFAQATWFGRTGSVWDAISNMVCAALGLVAAAIILFVFWKPTPAGKAKTGKR